jgi:3-oxoacyl-[acyl-carrier protein] reductase
MYLHLDDKLFLVTGASAGLGRAVAEALLDEGARVLAVARRPEPLEALAEAHGDRVEILSADVTLEATWDALLLRLADQRLDGMLVNAAGPPAKAFVETRLDDWDLAYQNLLRWKVGLTKTLLPKLLNQGEGRVLFIESMSVRQPLENLALSTALRLAVVGFVKTLAQEVASSGVTFNILAPGYHATERVVEIFEKKSEQLHISLDDARREVVAGIPMQTMGEPADLASLAAWLLSPLSRYVTGQTWTVDGGFVKGTL